MSKNDVVIRRFYIYRGFKLYPMVTIKKAIFPVVNSMDRRNRGLVLAYLYYGKDIDKHITQKGEVLYPFLEQLGKKSNS